MHKFIEPKCVLVLEPQSNFVRITKREIYFPIWSLMAIAEKFEARPRSHSLSALLGIEEQNTQQLIGRVRSGLPVSSFDAYQNAIGLSKAEISVTISLSSTTLSRKRKSGSPLPALESERLVRLAQLTQKAIELFEGDTDKAREWMKKPRAVLGDKSPLDMASTELGAREVENLILRLEEGVFS